MEIGVGKAPKCYSLDIMLLELDLKNLVARAKADLRSGLPVTIGDELIVSCETLSQTLLERLKKLPGELTAVITRHRAATLKARPYHGDIARLVIPDGANIGWFHTLADPSFDLSSPMKGPLVSKRGGPADAARAAIDLIKDAQLLPAVLSIPAPEETEGLTRLPVRELQAYLASFPDLNLVSTARLPISAHSRANLSVFRPSGAGDDHYVLEIGQPSRSGSPLVRLHSACFTGDVLGSLKCDCGPQLHGALHHMASEGSGVLLYLNQEGRGIGLANKMRAYALQDQGFDTVEANHRLGFEDDERDFRIGASLLKKLGFSQVRLLTNNPEKVSKLSENGITVKERVPHKFGLTDQNRDYMATKGAKSGHIL